MAGTVLVYVGVDGKPITDNDGKPIETIRIRSGGQTLAELPFRQPVRVHSDFAVEIATRYKRWYKEPKGFFHAMFSDKPAVRALAVSWTPQGKQYIYPINEIKDPAIKAGLLEEEQRLRSSKLLETIEFLKTYRAETADLDKQRIEALEQAERELKSPTKASPVELRDEGSAANFVEEVTSSGKYSDAVAAAYLEGAKGQAPNTNVVTFDDDE